MDPGSDGLRFGEFRDGMLSIPKARVGIARA